MLEFVLVPTSKPSVVPTSMPSAVPTSEPSALPTPKPSALPTSIPSAVPSLTIGRIQNEGLACSQMAAGIPELKTLTGIMPHDKSQYSYFSHSQ